MRHAMVRTLARLGHLRSEGGMGVTPIPKPKQVAHQRGSSDGSWAARTGLPGGGGAADSPPARPRLRFSASMLHIDEDPDHPLHPPPPAEPRPPPRPPARPG